MHISRDGLAEPEDLVLLRAVLRTGARSAVDRPTPTLQERFGVPPSEPNRPEAPTERARRTIPAKS
ncbi:hypothetical protein [Methylobacterium symbioticum]|uniref:Uncharacterized protein n=1 Tax=Methylobacterium symbioticum TaxID=2584084 RepID=A0A509E5M3_9HYPH|nr:hypothetical protein [Methylobacterium symbioticum]VUD69546.1 hypothetical protein MET9862_00097 [Methylobacterium symbioticum]